MYKAFTCFDFTYYFEGNLTILVIGRKRAEVDALCVVMLMVEQWMITGFQAEFDVLRFVFISPDI